MGTLYDADNNEVTAGKLYAGLTVLEVDGDKKLTIIRERTEALDKVADTLEATKKAISAAYDTVYNVVSAEEVPAPTQADADKTKPRSIAASERETETRLWGDADYQALLHNRDTYNAKISDAKRAIQDARNDLSFIKERMANRRAGLYAIAGLSVLAANPTREAK